VEQIFLEMRVVGRDAGNAARLCQAQPRVVGCKGGLDVYQIEVGVGKTAIQVGEGTPAHQAVFRIERHRARRQSPDVRFGIGPAVGSRIVGCYHRDPDAQSGEGVAEGLDRRRYAVDARESRHRSASARAAGLLPGIPG
jgi:hypothetical protein